MTYPDIYQKGLRKPMKISQNSQSLGWNLNMGSAKYEAQLVAPVQSIITSEDKKFYHISRNSYGHLSITFFGGS
jgi:hypothetical protein